MRTRLMIVLAVMMCAGVAALWAQATPPATNATVGGPRNGGQPGMRGTPLELSAELTLTADQKTKMQDILKQRQDQSKALRDDTTLTQDQKNAKRQELMKSFTTQINAVLTPDQLKKLEELQKTRMEQMKKMRETRAGNAPAAGAPVPAN